MICSPTWRTAEAGDQADPAFGAARFASCAFIIEPARKLGGRKRREAMGMEVNRFCAFDGPERPCLKVYAGGGEHRAGVHDPFGGLTGRL